jgi:polar amino acid transport system substrate-binding protein
MYISRNSIAAILAAMVMASGCAPVAPKAGDPMLRTELASTGKLRVGLIANNPSFVTQGTPPGVLKGVAVDIGNELARRMGVPMEPVRYTSVNALWAGVRNGEWDVAMLAIDPERAADMHFTGAYMFTENTLLTRTPEIRSLLDVDRSGNRIAAAGRSAQEAWLKANLKSARVVPAESMPAAEELVREGKVEGMMGNRDHLREIAARMPGARVLDGKFNENGVALAVPKGRPAALAFTYEFIEELKASGAIQESISRAGLTGARLAPKGAY